MLLFPLAVVVGILLGRSRGGRFQTLSTLRLHANGLVGLAVLLQLGLGFVASGTTWRYLGLVSSYGLMGVWLVANLRDGPNWRRGGLACVAAGYALNLVAILPNGGMPVSNAAMRRAGGSAASFQHVPNIDKHVAAGTGWTWLGDVVGVAPLGVVISAGDVAMLIGIVIVVCVGMTGVDPSLAVRGSEHDDAAVQAAG